VSPLMEMAKGLRFFMIGENFCHIRIVKRLIHTNLIGSKIYGNRNNTKRISMREKKQA